MIILNQRIEVIHICCMLLSNALIVFWQTGKKKCSNILRERMLIFMYFETIVKEILGTLSLQWHYKYLRGGTPK